MSIELSPEVRIREWLTPAPLFNTMWSSATDIGANPLFHSWEAFIYSRTFATVESNLTQLQRFDGNVWN